MPIATDKAALRQDIKEAYRKLRPLLGGFAPSQQHAPLLQGQRKSLMMSPHDLLAYLVGWAELVLSWRRRWLAEGQVQQIPAAGFGRMARHFYGLHAAMPYAALLSRLDDAVVDVLAMVDGCSEAELYGTVWYTARSSGRTYTFGRLVQMNTAAPYRNARSRIGHWKKRAARRATVSAATEGMSTRQAHTRTAAPSQTCSVRTASTPTATLQTQAKDEGAARGETRCDEAPSPGVRSSA